MTGDTLESSAGRKLNLHDVNLNCLAYMYIYIFCVRMISPVCLCVCINMLIFVCICVFRTNNVEDHVVEQNSGLQIDDLRSVSGKELFKNNQYLVRITYTSHSFP